MSEHNAQAAVLDASVVNAFLFGESGAETARTLVRGGVIGADNLTEVVRCALREGYPGTPEHLIGRLRLLGLTVVTTITLDQVARAAELVHISHQEKDQHEKKRTLARGDGQALALAEHLGLPAITGDRLWVEYAHLVNVPVKLFR
ncbi:PIN domain-containing protein [Kitasatospora sp. NPDC001603]|uniref:PIN domain-containing protein n=1 Tax=Kitasatospora sp. NPDC001603 TaxID=3154388 RepID=UPI00332B32AA